MYHLEVLGYTFVDGETHQRAHFLPTVCSGSARIDMQQVKLRVGHNAQYMGVAADKDAWTFAHQQVAYAGRIASGISANVCHDHLGAFGLEDEKLGTYASQLRPVDIAGHSPKHRRYTLQTPVGIDISYIACVPNLVDPRKVFFYAGVVDAVGVGKYSDTLHTPETKDLFLADFLGDGFGNGILMHHEAHGLGKEEGFADINEAIVHLIGVP